MRASGLLTRPATITYLCIAALWGACLAGALAFHETTSRAADIYRLGAFSVRALQLSHELQQEQVLSLGFAAGELSGPAPGSLLARHQTTNEQVAAYNTARGRFNERRFGADLSGALKDVDAALERLSGMRGDIQSGTADAKSVMDFYSGLIANLELPLKHLAALNSYSPQSADLRTQIAALTKWGRLAAREAALGSARATGREFDPELLAEWQSLPAKRKALLAEYEGSGNAPALAGLTSAQDSQPARKARSLFESIRNEPGQSADEAFRADLLIALSENLQAIHNSTIARLVQVNSDARRTTRHNGFIITALVVVAALSTLALVCRHRPGASRQAFIVLMLAFNLALTVWALTTEPNIFSHETGPLETLQAFTIAIAFALFCREVVSLTGPPRMAAVVLAAACFQMFFREVDFQLLDAPAWVVQLTSGPVRRVSFLIMVLIVAAYAALQRHHARALARQVLSFPAWPLFAWVILLIMGEAVEAIAHQTRKDELPGYWAGGQFFEELLELNGYIALLFAACVFRSIFPPDATNRGVSNGGPGRDPQRAG